MTPATAEYAAQPLAMPPELLGLPAEDGDEPPISDATETAEALTEETLNDEIRIGFEKLREMDPNQLRQVITRRVEMLETELREREDRRAAIETARLASRMLEIRRDRAIRIQRRVNFGSAMAAVASTFLIVAVMI